MKFKIERDVIKGREVFYVAEFKPVRKSFLGLFPYGEPYETWVYVSTFVIAGGGMSYVREFESEADANNYVNMELTRDNKKVVIRENN